MGITKIVNSKAGRIALGCLVAAMAVLAAYSNHFGNGFHFDDAHTIVNNGFIRSVRSIPRFFSDATTFSALPTNQSYRPVVSATLAVDYWLGRGLKPFWFQVSNFLVFVAGSALLGVLVHRLLEGRHEWVAVIAAAAYALLPGNADTVNYIIARSDLLSTLGIVGGFAMYLLLPGWRRWHGYLLPVAVAMLAKPVTVVFAPLFALYVLLFMPWRGVLRYVGAIAPALIVCGALAVFVQKMTPHTWVAGSGDTGQYLATQPYVAMLYFKTFFLPAGLSADYDLAPLTNAADTRLWAGIGFGICLAAGGIVAVCFRCTRVIGFGLLWFLITLLPTSLFPLAEVMNDHRPCIAYMGMVIALAGAVTLLPAWGLRVAAGVAVCLLGASAIATYQRNAVWKDDVALWHDAVLKGPGNGRARMNYGTALMGQGRLQDAYVQFQEAKNAAPYYPILYVNLAVVEAAMGNQPQAERDFQTALRLGPQYPDCHTYYARWLLDRGDLDAAESQLRQSVQLSPGDLEAKSLLTRVEAMPHPTDAAKFLDLSLTEFRAAHYAQSIAAAEQALKARPDYAEAYNNIGAAWNALGRFDLGAVACRTALRLKPVFPLARNNLNYALAMAAGQQKIPR